MNEGPTAEPMPTLQAICHHFCPNPAKHASKTGRPVSCDSVRGRYFLHPLFRGLEYRVGTNSIGCGCSRVNVLVTQYSSCAMPFNVGMASLFTGSNPLPKANVCFKVLRNASIEVRRARKGICLYGWQETIRTTFLSTSAIVELEQKRMIPERVTLYIPGSVIDSYSRPETKAMLLLQTRWGLPRAPYM